MITLIFLLVVMGTRVDCELVQFFGKENYESFIRDYNTNGDDICYTIDIPRKAADKVGSVKTNQCLILFEDNLCNTREKYSLIFDSISVKTDTPKLARMDHSKTSPLEPQKVGSFALCSRKYGGGPEVDVTFYGTNAYGGNKTAEFRDVCGCQNLVKDVVGGKSKIISVNNHGNSIDLFEREHCTGPMRRLEGGNSGESRYLWPNEPSFDVHSFRPTDNRYCVNLNASIYKFEFENGTQEMVKNTTMENVKLAVDSVIKSNGAATIVQDYTVSGRIVEGVDYTVATGYTNMSNAGVDAEVETTVGTGVPLLADGGIKVKVTGSYKYQRSDTGSTTNRTSTTTEDTITARQQITIPACTECVVSSLVKKVKNFPIQYKSYAKVTGNAGGTRMTVAEIRAALRPEVKYLRDVDPYTVDVMIDGVMYAEYGMSSYINADCKPIPGCKKNSLLKKAESFKLSYEVPIVRSQ